jgi:hypothetical protein
MNSVKRELENRAMKFNDPQLQQHFERTMSLRVGNLPDEQLPVFALMDAYGWFRLIDSEQSSQVHEIIEHLLLPELRPALRNWYNKSGNSINPAVLEFRERLSKLAGEKFG